MRPYAALLVTLALLLLAVPVEGGVVDVEGVLRVEWHPDPIRLGSGERGTIHMTVESLTTEPIVVALFFLKAKGPGACGGNVSPEMFALDLGSQQTVRVEIRSYASLQYHGIDCLIEVRWSRNLTVVAQGHIDRDTADGQERITLPIDDDFSSVIFTMAAVVAILVALVVAVAYQIRRRKGPVSSRGAIPEELSVQTGPFR